LRICGFFWGVHLALPIQKVNQMSQYIGRVIAERKIWSTL
jgi:hypothetical protein